MQSGADSVSQHGGLRVVVVTRAVVVGFTGSLGLVVVATGSTGGVGGGLVTSNGAGVVTGFTGTNGLGGGPAVTVGGSGVFG